MSKKFIRNSKAEEQEIARHAREDGTEFTDAELVRCTRFAKVGRPPKNNPKRSTTIRFDPDVLDAFQSSGPGWQTRMNNALRDWLKENRP